MSQATVNKSSRHWFWLAISLIGAYLLYILAPIITPFAVAGLLAYMSDPLIDRVERWHIRSWIFGRTLAVVLVFLTITLVLFLGLLVILPLLVKQFRELVSFIPVLVDWFSQTAVPWAAGYLGFDPPSWNSVGVTDLLKDYWREVSGAALDVVETLGRGGAWVMALVGNLVLIPVIAFYLMRDWDKLITNIQNLLPRSVVEPVSNLFKEIDEVLGAFVRGQLLVMLGLGMMYATGLWVMGLQMAFLIGLIAGLLSIVPYLGTAVGVAIAVGVAVFQFGDALHVLMVLIVFSLGQMTESMFLTPKLVGDRIGLHPVAVIFAVLAGGSLFGFLGILLALPVSAALNVVANHAQDLYRSSSLYE